MNLLKIAIAGVLPVALIGCGGSSSRSGDVSAPVASSKAGVSESRSEPVAPLPFNASGLLAGTANPSLPEGEQGKVSVVQVGPLSEQGGAASLPIAFRNNTAEGISHIDWTGTARSSGSIVATGSSQGTIPAQVKPGEIGLAFIYFGNGSPPLPADAQYEFTVNTSKLDQDSYNTAPLKVTEANLRGDAVVGAARNQTGESVEGPFSVSVYCFEGDKLLGEHGAYAEQNGPAAADAQVTFSASLYGSQCPTFAVGVGGYFSQ